jgi:hypothetical protein
MVMTTEKHRCCGRTYKGFYGSACGRNAKVERNGKWYCGMHDPVAIAEKREARNKEFDLKWAAERAQEAKKEAEQKEKKRRADCFPELLEALKVMTALCRLRYGNLDAGVFAEIEKAEASIAKAEGETA